MSVMAAAVIAAAVIAATMIAAALRLTAGLGGLRVPWCAMASAAALRMRLSVHGPVRAVACTGA